jgi:Asp/Glu/hydantoin racemase
MAAKAEDVARNYPSRRLPGVHEMRLAWKTPLICQANGMAAGARGERKAMIMLGILSLDTAFQRIPGDVGNPDSYPFAAQVRVVRGADSTAVVKDGIIDEALLQSFIAAAVALEKQGASAIVSTCGFLITAQSRIAAAVQIPVMLSALSMYPVVHATTPGRIGILTASQSALGAAALDAAGANMPDVVIQGMQHEPDFAATFLVQRDQQRRSFDRAAMERSVVAAALDLQARAPDLRAIILECGNLPPYAQALRAATGLPIYHLLDAAIWMMAANSGTKHSMA